MCTRPAGPAALGSAVGLAHTWVAAEEGQWAVAEIPGAVGSVGRAGQQLNAAGQLGAGPHQEAQGRLREEISEHRGAQGACSAVIDLENLISCFQTCQREMENVSFHTHIKAAAAAATSQIATA